MPIYGFSFRKSRSTVESSASVGSRKSSEVRNCDVVPSTRVAPPESGPSTVNGHLPSADSIRHPSGASRIEKSGHQPGPQALVAIEADRETLLRAKPGQHPHAGAGVAEVERPPRIGKDAAGSGDLPDIVVFTDLRAKQPGGLEGRARVGRLERRDEHTCAVRGQRRRNAADRVGLQSRSPRFRRGAERA